MTQPNCRFIFSDEERLLRRGRDDSFLTKLWRRPLVGDWDHEQSRSHSHRHNPTQELLTAASYSASTATHDFTANTAAALHPVRARLTLIWGTDNPHASAAVDNCQAVDVSAQFDASGRRVAHDDGTTAPLYVQRGRQTTADCSTSTKATIPTCTYVHASYIDGPVVSDRAGGLRYYHCGQQYSITALTDSSGTIKEGYAYDAYGGLSIFDGAGGSRTATTEGNRYTYTGREWDDDLSFYHFRARMYDPVSGRFLSRDPIGYLGGGFGLYSNMFGQSEVDPSGKSPCEKGDCRIANANCELEGILIEANMGADDWEGVDIGDLDDFDGLIDEFDNYLKWLAKKLGIPVKKLKKMFLGPANPANTMWYGLRVRLQFECDYEITTCVSKIFGCGNRWSWTDMNESVDATIETHNIVFGSQNGYSILNAQDRQAIIDAIRNMFRRGSKIQSKETIKKILIGSVESHAINDSFANCKSIVDWDSSLTIDD